MKIPIGRIPRYVTASTLKGLRRSMLRVQINLGYGVNFFDIQKNGKTWFAFYYDSNDINLHNLGEQLADSDEN